MSKFRLQSVVFVLTAFLLGCNEFMVVGVISDIAKSYQASLSTVGFLVTSFAIIYAICTPLITTFTGKFDRFKVQAIGKRPRGFGRVTFDRMREGVHTGGSGQALRHRGHHIGIDDRDVGDIVRVNANEFSLAFNIGYNIVDGRFRRGSRGCRNGDRENGSVFCRRNAFKTAYISKFGVIYDNSDGFARIHGRAAADRYHIIRARRLICGDAALDVFDRRIGLYIGIKLILYAGILKNIGNLF